VPASRLIAMENGRGWSAPGPDEAFDEAAAGWCPVARMNASLTRSEIGLVLMGCSSSSNNRRLGTGYPFFHIMRFQIQVNRGSTELADL
jgi:hypothetical protein